MTTNEIILTSSDVNHLTSWRLEPCIATGKSKFSWMNWRLWPPLTLQDFIFEPGSQGDFCSSWKMLTSGTKFIWVWRIFFSSPFGALGDKGVRSGRDTEKCSSAPKCAHWFLWSLWPILSYKIKKSSAYGLARLQEISAFGCRTKRLASSKF